MTVASSPSPEASQRNIYRGVLLTASVLAALVTLLVITLLMRDELNSALADLMRGQAIIETHTRLIETLIAAPLLFAALAALVMWRAIWATRVTRYMSFLRVYCQNRLRRDAPLIALGITPTTRPLGTAADEAAATRPVADALAANPRSLLLGAAGTGKTAALLAYAQALSDRTLASRLAFGVRRESLPVLISLPGLARSLDEASPSVTPYIATLLGRMGTAGLGARADTLLKYGRITLLCDDYDKLDDDERERINAALQTLHEGRYKACRLVVTCESDAYTTVIDDHGPLSRFAAIELSPVPLAELGRALERRQQRQRRARRSVATSALSDDLRQRPVGLSLRIAAIAAALTESLAAGDELPWGRAEALRARMRLAGATATPHDLDAAESQPTEGSEQPPALGWLALAASLQDAECAYVPLDPTRTAGECVQKWMIGHPPPGPTDFALSATPELSTQRIERDIQAGLRAGVLQRSFDGLTLGFSHSLAQISAAAWWLDLRDDGLGRLNSQLLRPQWALPVALWAGAHPEPHDLAQRIFRFANAPASTAPRAGIHDRLDTYPQALALALAAVLEGVAPRLARMAVQRESQTNAFILAQQGLRDLLDTCVVYGADPARRQRLSRALGRIQREVGDEFAAYLGTLAREASLDRLLRAQLTTTLGLTATNEAISELMSLLVQSDPTMRQAIEQALIYAGASAIPALQASVRSGSAAIRHRAEEALRLLSGVAPAAGEAAEGAALAGLNSPDAGLRRVAVTTLSAIGASEALNDLIARLDDVNVEVRLAAAAALGQLGGKHALLALRRRCSSNDVRLRLAVAQALGVDPSSTSTPSLLRLLKDRDARVRAAAATSLGGIADKRAIGPLREASEDTDPWVRHAAQTAVRRYTGG